MGYEMKYIEELKSGQIFNYNKEFFILSSDFRYKNKIKEHSVIAINTGNIHWLKTDTIIDIVPIFYQNTDNQLQTLQ